MKTAISLPDGLFQEAEELAKRLRVSRSELYRRALEAYLERQRDRLITEALNAVYGDEDSPSELDPVLTRLQELTLAAEEW